MKALTTIAFIAAISSGVLLAVIRGDVFSHQVKDTTPVIIMDDAEPVATDTSSSFYSSTLMLLRATMMLLALAMELAAGLALRDARRLGQVAGEDSAALTAEVARVHKQMISCLFELTTLENEAEIFIARFWREFYRAMLRQTTRRALDKLLAITVCAGILFVVPNRALAADRLNLVVMVDLTRSVAVKGHDGKTEYEKNLKAVTQLLARMPAGAHITVFGITDNSFAQPYILLSADIGSDEGYFHEKLASARRQLVSIWQRRIEHLQTDFSRTDILGALLLAHQLFDERNNGWKDVLVIFSDMRQNSDYLDLEDATKFDPKIAIGKTDKRGLISPLHNVQVYALGVDNVDRQIVYWDRLREYWLEYFAKAEAQVVSYSALRKVR